MEQDITEEDIMVVEDITVVEEEHTMEVAAAMQHLLHRSTPPLHMQLLQHQQQPTNSQPRIQDITTTTIL